MTHTLTPHDLLAVAVEAHVDPRTVKRFLAGEDIRPTLDQRVKAAIVKLDLTGKLPTCDSADRGAA